MDRQLEILKRRAEEGDAWAQERLAKFDVGELPVRSQKHSDPIYMQHLKEQAEQDDAQAQFELGWEYANGKKSFRNYKTAAKWFRKAAEQGHTPAQRELGCMYYDGEGVAQNFEKAVYWWEKAAKAGDSQAMTYLGYYYLDNAPEAPDYASAVKWWEQAAECGDDIAAYNLHIFYHERKDGDKEHKWLRRSAELGNARAQYMVYLESKGVEIYWLLRAAIAGNIPAAEPTDDELKYIEEIKFCLEDDGAIDDKERRHLERMQAKFGISAERASRLETMAAATVKAILSPEEQEYCDAMAEYAADGELSERDLRLLARLASSLNISPEREKELQIKR